MTIFPVLLSMAIMELLQLNIAGLFLSQSIVSSNKSKCCLKTVILAIFDQPQSMLPYFLSVRFCLFWKFLNHLSPGPVSELNLFGWSLFLVIAQANVFTVATERGD